MHTEQFGRCRDYNPNLKNFHLTAASNANILLKIFDKNCIFIQGRNRIISASVENIHKKFLENMPYIFHISTKYITSNSSYFVIYATQFHTSNIDMNIPI